MFWIFLAYHVSLSHLNVVLLIMDYIEWGQFSKYYKKIKPHLFNLFASKYMIITYNENNNFFLTLKHFLMLMIKPASHEWHKHKKRQNKDMQWSMRHNVQRKRKLKPQTSKHKLRETKDISKSPREIFSFVFLLMRTPLMWTKLNYRPIAHDVKVPVTMHLEDKLAIYA